MYEVIVVIIKVITFWDTVIFRINKLSYLMARTYLNFRLGLINVYADSSELLKICHTIVGVPNLPQVDKVSFKKYDQSKMKGTAFYG
jgi:hypothetical protein